MKRVVACALALCLTVCLFAGTASAAAREPISKFTIPLADNVNLIEMTHAGGIFTDPKDVLQQHALTYQPGGDVQPMVIYGSTLYGRSTMSKIATYLDNQNLSLVAGVNGSFFDMSTGIPYGLIVTDGVFSMGGDICKLPEIVELAQKYKARVMVDDAHGLGVIGNGGRGTADYFGLTDKVDIIMGTFSKSLASLGGYMAGDKRVVNYVRHASRPFIFCASIPPANCATAIEALHILRSHPEMPKRLVELAAYMRKGLLERGIAIRDSITPIIPIYTYDEMRTLRKAKELFDAGVYVNPVLPPATPPRESLLRTSYMANHTETILDEALDIIERIVKND